MERDPLNTAARLLFGVPYLFPYQRLVIANILEAAEARGIRIRWPQEKGPGAGEAPGEEAWTDREGRGRQIVILPTGAGKSLCFQLPALLLSGPTLVIYPLLALMADQERRLRERGFTPVVFRGGQSREERAALAARLGREKNTLLIANPEVLLTPAVMGQIGAWGIRHTVIDEAHCVSEWGNRFRPAYKEIHRIIRAAGTPLITAFTATASPLVLEEIRESIFGDEGAHLIRGNPDRPNIRYAAMGCLLRDLAVRDLILAHERPSLVFCSSRRGTEKLAQYLRSELEDRDIRFFHAGLSREEKDAVGAWYLAHNRGVLVATCAFGLGIDKPDIRTVVHRDCPPSVEAYLQESGRAGRDGLPAQAVLLWGPGDDLARRRAGDENAGKRLAALLAYGRDTQACRRQTLLRLLDDHTGPRDMPVNLPPACCDVCAGQAGDLPREIPVLMEFFRRNRRRYTPEEAASLLARFPELRWSEEEAKGAIYQLIREGRLRVMNNLLWKRKVTPAVCRRKDPSTPGSRYSSSKPRSSSSSETTGMAAFSFREDNLGL